MRNLILDELFIGAWVRRWMGENLQTEPLVVTGLFAGGRLYLESSPHEGDPFDAEVKELYPVRMDEDVLRGFGFVKVAKGENVWMRSSADLRLTVSLRYRHGIAECRRAAISGRFACWNEEIRYVHELQAWWRDKVLVPYGVEMPMQWRGFSREDDELKDC